jgi:oligogalacturonide lyase
MTTGKSYPSESRTLTDERTGATVRQVTDHPSIHHHPFFFIPAHDAAMRRLFFISYRTGSAQIFCEERDTGSLRQLTDRDDIHDWSVYPSRDARHVFFTAGNGAWRLNLETLAEQELVNFGNASMIDDGMVGPSMGTTALSWDDRWWAVSVKWGKGFRFYVINTENGDHDVILERQKIGHPQVCPDDANLIHYIADMVERTWVINRDGTENRLIYSRNADKNEWITHESWLPGRREISFVDWPHRVRAIDVDTRQERVIAEFNAWHAMASWDGKMMAADTNFPDNGVHIFDPRKNGAKPRRLCTPGATQLGSHWGGSFPYADGPIKVYAPQHTHVHPNFAPDNSCIVYSSDATGHAQIYECSLPSTLRAEL